MSVMGASTALEVILEQVQQGCSGAIFHHVVLFVEAEVQEHDLICRNVLWEVQNVSE